MAMSEKWYSKLDDAWGSQKGCTCLHLGGPTGILRMNSPECPLHEDLAITGSLTPDEVIALILEEISARRHKVN